MFSKLFYCSALWAGTYKQNIHKLQLIQNFAARILTDTGKYDHITPALKALGWLTIEELLWLRDVTMMYKCVNNLVPAYISCKIGKRSNAHAYNLRNSEDLNLPGCRTAAAQSGFFYRAAKAWNSLSNNTRTARSLRSFKKHAKAELMKKIRYRYTYHSILLLCYLLLEVVILSCYLYIKNMYIISLSCIIYTYCKLILKSPSGRINKKVLYCIVYFVRAKFEH